MRVLRVRVGAPLDSTFATPKADWKMELYSCGVMSKRAVAAISGDEAKARVLGNGFERLKADWKMERDDLRTFRLEPSGMALRSSRSTT